MEKLCLEVCEDLLKHSTFQNKTVLSSCCKSSQDDANKVEVKVTTGTEQFTFILKFLRNETKNVYHNQRVRTCEDNVGTLVTDVYVSGYNEIKFGNATVEELRLILKTLASDHASIIKKNLGVNSPHQDKTFIPEKWSQSYRDILTDFVRNENIKEIRSNLFLKEIDKLVDASQAIFTSNAYIYVTSNILQKKIFYKNSTCRIIPVGTEVGCNLVYDALLTIFWLSNQNLRQRYIHTLLNYYYDTLREDLKKVGLDLKDILSTEAYEQQLYIFNPYVKMQILKQLCHTTINSETVMGANKYKHAILTSMLELNECILYPKLSREDCYKIVDNSLQTSQCSLIKYELMPLQERAGYLGDYFKVKINIMCNNKEVVLYLFAKYVPTFAELPRRLAIKSFKKEEFFYQKFIPNLVDLGLADICNFLPKCCFSRSEDVLIFEDVSQSGFSSLKLDTSLSRDAMILVIKQLAKLHACSLLYEEIMTRKTKRMIRLDGEYGEFLEDMVFASTVDEGILEANNCAMRTFLSMFEMFPEILENISMDEFKSRAKVALSSIYDKVKKSDRFRNVICQGDGWVGNLLFKMNKNNEATDCYVIDYQLTRYCPPASDLLYFIYMVTDRDTRTMHMSEFIDEYYLELSKIFRTYNFDLKDVYTYEQFLECCNYMKSESLTHSAIILQMVLYPIEKIMPILGNEKKAKRFFSDQRPEFLEEMNIDGPYRNRVKGIIEDFYEYCMSS